MPDYEQPISCFGCGTKVVSDDDFCYGCKQFICSTCSVNPTAGGHGHDPADHLSEPDEDEW